MRARGRDRSRDRGSRVRATPAVAAHGRANAGWTRTLWSALVVGAAVLMVHGRTVTFGFSHLDDDHLLVDRWASLRHLSYVVTGFREPYFAMRDPGEGYYRPFVTASFVLDAAGRLHPDAAPFHRTNVALHLVASVLFLLLLRQLGVAEALALALGLAFAVHPAFTMAVAWIPGRNDLLLGVFLLGAWLAFGRAGARQPAWRLALHLALFGAAMLTKEAAIVLPALLLAQRWLLEGERPDARRDVVVWAGWGAVSLAWWMLRAQVESGGQLIPLGARLGYFRDRLPGLLAHLGKLVLPFDLAPLANQRDSTLLWGWISLALVVGMLIVARGRARRLAVLGAGVFLAFVLPTLAVSNTLLLENRLYLPAVGLALVIAGASSAASRAAVIVGGALVALGFAVATFRYESCLKSPRAFADALMRTTPEVALAQTVAGDVWRESGDFTRSEAAYRKSLQLDPRQWRIHNNLGVFELRRGNLVAAEADFRTEIARNPGLDVAHENLAMTLWRMQRVDEAAGEWAEAVRLNPAIRENVVTLYRVYIRNGLHGQADALRQALAAHGVDAEP